ncbi:AN1-type zinc finger protein 4 [Engraulis encrasicolus]|uniref:AN1-type zinc finger protein 4 n=1 Tax=Engraulis encrasicolus TaxID=184585 RepID=UPI002FD73159
MAHRKEPPFFNNDHLSTVPYKLAFYETMELFIETLTGTCFELRVSPFETVISVKAKIQRLEGIPVAQQHLIWNSLELEDEYCLHDYNIAEGCTLKLVLAMRGGPINTRRVTVDNPLKEMAEYMEASQEEVWEKAVPNKQVTFLVYREGDQLNFFRVVDRGDGTLTPVSESLSGGSVYNVYAEEDEEAEGIAMGQQALENSITMTKMKLLKAKMENMNLSKKPKKSAKLKPRPPVGPRACSSSSSSTLMAPGRHHHHHRLLRVHPPQGGQLHAHAHTTTTHLPPIEIQQQQQQLSDPAAGCSSHTALSSSRLLDRASASQAAPPLPPPLFHHSYALPAGGDKPWEYPVSKKLRPPPKVSRLEVAGGSRLLTTGCVYPPPLSVCASGRGSKAQPEHGHPMDASELSSGAGTASRLLTDSAAALPEKAKLLPLSELLHEPLSLELPGHKEGGAAMVDTLGAVAAEHLPSTTTTAPLLSQAMGPSSSSVGASWAIGTEQVTSNGGRLGSLHLATEPAPSSFSSSSSGSSSSASSSSGSSSSCSPSSQRLLQPFEFTGASPLQRSSPPHCRLAPDDRSPLGLGLPVPLPVAHAPSTTTATAHGKRPGGLSRSEARDITKMANKAAKEPMGSLSSAELLASLARQGGGGGGGVGAGREAPSGPGGLLPPPPLPPPPGSGCPRMLERLERICSPDPLLQARLQASLQELHQDLLRRICPMQQLQQHRAATHAHAHVSSLQSPNSLSASGPSSTIRRLGTPTYHLPPVKPPLSSKKKGSKHCFFCGKKTGLATSYECRCGNNFCASHRYAEVHNCSYDYKTAGRRLLQDTNPIVSAPKLPKI